MFKKSFAAIAVAGLLVLGGSAAAFAEGPSYPPTVTVVANPGIIGIGVPSTIVITGTNFAPGESVSIDITSTSPSGGSLSSIVFAANGSGSVTKPLIDGKATATFVATVAGEYTIVATGPEGVSGSTTITVTGTTAGTDLPATGGTTPIAAIWLGVGALGIGGIAVAAATARRRAQRGN